MKIEQSKALRLADELRAAPERSRTSFEAADELRRLHQHELAHIKWLEKTEWVQATWRKYGWTPPSERMTPAPAPKVQEPAWLVAMRRVK